MAIRDPTLVARLQQLLPRPDYPIDELIRNLIEKPGKVPAEKVAEVERKVESLAKAVEELRAEIASLTQRIDMLAGQVKEIRPTCQAEPYLALLIPARLEDQGPEASPGSPANGREEPTSAPGRDGHGEGKTASGGGEWLDEAIRRARKNGGCIKFAELREILGHEPGSHNIKKLYAAGFAKTEYGVYCLGHGE